MFGFFKKKEKVKEEKPKLKIYDDNGEEILVDRDKWIENFFNVEVNKNHFNNEGLYNIILIALGYKVYEESLEATFRLMDLENRSFRSMELLMEIYFNLEIYDEVVNVIESYKKDHSLTPALYHYYAKSLLQLDYKAEYTNTVYEAISRYPNNKKIIDEIKNVLSEKDDNTKNLLMEELSKINGSYVLCLYFAKVEYEKDHILQGNKYILKALKYGASRYEVLVKASEMLFEKNQFLEFENHILSKISPFEVKEPRILSVLLTYYNSMYKYQEGLELLRYMYRNNLYKKEDIKGLVNYEYRFLNYKFERENPRKFIALSDNMTLGEINYINIKHPLYYYILNKDAELEIEKTENRVMMILPIAIADGLKLKAIEKTYLDNMPITLLERFYKKTSMKIQISYSKDDVSIKHPSADYTDEFFFAVHERSPKITDILAGAVKQEEGKMVLEVYVYDCLENKRKVILKTDFVTGDALARKYLDELSYHYGVKADVDVLENEIINKNSILELFFDFKEDSAHKLWNFIYLLDYYISNASYENLLNALSLVQFMKAYKINLNEDYRNLIYKANVNLNNDAMINKMINKVFGDSE